MEIQVTGDKTADHTNKYVSLIGFWAAVLTSLLAGSAFAVGITTPPRSGPFCINSCITYPYIDVAAFVPADYLWMYPAFLLAPVFAVLMTCIHHYASATKGIFSRISLSFALISSTVISIDYFIQLAVMQPALLKEEIKGLSVFSQYNPHGIFIALEDLGYLMMSVSLLFAAAVFSRNTGIERTIRWLFITAFELTIITLIALSIIYRQNLDYRFEVTVIIINWTVLVVSGILLGFIFKQAI